MHGDTPDHVFQTAEETIDFCMETVPAYGLSGHGAATAAPVQEAAGRRWNPRPDRRVAAHRADAP